MRVIKDIVRTDGFEMEYCRFGQGARTLVILPGLSVQSVLQSADAVARAYGSMTDAFTVWLFDRRRDLPPVYTVSDMARDTAAAFRALGLSDVCLFGASQGGMIAMQMAIEQPPLVRRLALGSTAARVGAAQTAVLDRWIDLAAAGDRAALYLDFGEKLYPPAMFQKLRPLLLSAAETVTDEELARFVVLAAGARGFDIADRLGALRCPVLVLGDRGDAVLGAEASREIAAALRGRPDCALHLYEGYGHAAYDTAPDYKERLRAFFEG